MTSSLSPDFRGGNCSEEFDVCQGRCENGGTCSAIADGHYFKCSCPLGYSGQHCEIAVVDCPPDATCLNGGTMMEPSCSCTCPPEYTGALCETVDRCRESLCPSNAICFNTAQEPGYVCVCEEGWAGLDCQVNVTQCRHENGTPIGEY